MATVGAPLPLADLPVFVRNHMTNIKSTKMISTEELYIKVVANSLQYAGIIVDCPGTLISTEGIDLKFRKKEEDFLESVKAIIAQQVQAANPQNSVILCLEYKSRVQTEGGCGAFYNAVLSKVPGFDSFKSRVKIIFNRNDDQCQGSLGRNGWIEGFSRVDNMGSYRRTYDEIKQFFFNGPPKHDIFFICMKNLDRLYAENPDRTEDEISELRDELLDNNSNTLTKLFQETFPDLDRTFKSDYSFSFANLKNKVFDEIERSSEDFAKQALDDLDHFISLITKNLNVLRVEADYDSRKDNSTLVNAAWRSFETQLSRLAEESLMNTTGIPSVDLHFDEDSFCQNFHSRFPLNMNFPWYCLFTLSSYCCAAPTNRKVL